MQQKVNRVVGAVLDGLFPWRCVLCGLPAQRQLALCPDCEAELAPNRHGCGRCALPLPPGTPPGSPCGRCLVTPPPFSEVIAPWLYSDTLAYIIGRWKYAGQWHLSALLAYLWLSRAGPYQSPDLLLPVPLHWYKRWRRGANQSELLGQALLRHPHLAGVSLDAHLARRARATTAQYRLDARARRRNLRGAFTVGRRCDNLHIVVLDDIMTTGATAAAISQALLEQGAARVDVWCLARTPPLLQPRE